MERKLLRTKADILHRFVPCSDTPVEEQNDYYTLGYLLTHYVHRQLSEFLDDKVIQRDY